MVLTKSEAQIMRGVSIVCIVLHNLLHWLLPTVENEFTFSIEKTELFFNELSNFKLDLWKDAFSFLGWYGVVVFLFLTGYGLSVKYGFSDSNSNIKPGEFIVRHFKKLFLLMILPYLPFALKAILSGSYIQVLSQLSLLSNIVNPSAINPGIFWYFGLVFQLYVLYALLVAVKKGNSKRLLLLILNVVSIILLLAISEMPNVLSWVRHNSIGWILPFSLGICFSRNDIFTKLYDKPWKNLLWVFLGSVLIVLSNLNYLLWVISPVFSIMAMIAVAKLFCSINVLHDSFVWLGGLSAYLFAVHPLTRMLCIKFCPTDMLSTWCIFAYLLISILTALIYKKVHAVVFRKIL